MHNQEVSPFSEHELLERNLDPDFGDGVRPGRRQGEQGPVPDASRELAIRLFFISYGFREDEAAAMSWQGFLPRPK